MWKIIKSMPKIILILFVLFQCKYASEKLGFKNNTHIISIGATVRISGLISDEGATLNGKIGYVIQGPEISPSKAKIVIQGRSRNITELEKIIDLEPKIGSTVQIHGLGHPEFQKWNYQIGKIIQYFPSRDRYGIQIEGQIDMKSLKLQNLIVLPMIGTTVQLAGTRMKGSFVKILEYQPLSIRYGIMVGRQIKPKYLKPENLEILNEAQANITSEIDKLKHQEMEEKFECFICFSSQPLALTYPCCKKQICGPCIFTSAQYQTNGKCPFCRTKRPDDINAYEIQTFSNLHDFSNADLEKVFTFVCLKSNLKTIRMWLNRKTNVKHKAIRLARSVI
jgi:hypothetical protein